MTCQNNYDFFIPYLSTTPLTGFPFLNQIIEKKPILYYNYIYFYHGTDKKF